MTSESKSEKALWLLRLCSLLAGASLTLMRRGWPDPCRREHMVSLWQQRGRAGGEPGKDLGNWGLHELDREGSVAKMMAPLLSFLDVICHVRAFLVPEVSPCTLGIQQVLNKYL